MRAPFVAGFIVLASLAAPVTAQTVAPPLQITPPQISAALSLSWEVKNRFRLFRREADFNRQVAAHSLKTVLAAEQQLAAETDGRGWAGTLLAHLCVDALGNIPAECERDGTRESYLAPADHRIGVRVAGAPAGARCAWSFDDGDGTPQQTAAVCSEEVRLRVRYGRVTNAMVDVAAADGSVTRAMAEIQVRDLLIAGLGDSIAAGEGNPDRPITLADEGFCFRRFLGGTRSEYFRPGRIGFRGDKSCEGTSTGAELQEWGKLGARWLNQACHRSLYGYQLRTALALATENPHAAVTFLPLACTGATIEAGLLGSVRARELNCTPDRSCANPVPGQIGQLQQWLNLAKRRQADRALDLVLLTIGANDIDFSGLVADVIIESTADRLLFRRSGMISYVEDAAGTLERKLPRDFARLRAALKPLVGGDLARVVFVSYSHPGIGPDGRPCADSLDGFDVHPSFKIDGERMRRVSDFVRTRFLPRIKALAQCDGTGCKDETDRMNFVDSHQPAFVGRGMCARSPQDPVFDRECFSPEGKTFAASPVEGATEPLVCGLSAREFRPYASRARWIRTANDSYFIAMTYPEGLPASQQPSDIHDATWGVLSAVYGGAVHPTAEGHAAMADAAIVTARKVLGLGDAPLVTEPLPAPQRTELPPPPRQ